jgi:signal transduction histidine kinase
MNLDKTLPANILKRTQPARRSLRTRWRLYMVLGMNLLMLLVIGSVSAVTVANQYRTLSHLHETSAAQVRIAVQQQFATVRHTMRAAAQRDPAVWPDLVAAAPGLTQLCATTPDDAPAACVPAEADRAAGVRLEEAGLIAWVDAPALLADTLAADIGAAGYSYLVAEDGALVVLPPDQDGRDLPDVAAYDVYQSAQAGDPQFTLYDGITGGRVLGRGEAIAGTPFVVITEAPLSDLAPFVVRLVALWVMGLVLTAVVGEILVHRILRTVLGPVDVLRKGARAVGGGDYTYRIRIPRSADRELAELGQAFNTMIVRLQESQQQIAAYTTEMETIVDLRARELSRKAMQLEVAAEVSSKIATILDPDELMNQVVKLLRERFQVYRAAIIEVGQDGRLTLGTEQHLASPPELTTRDAEHSVVAWVARHGEMLYVPNVTQDPRYLRLAEFPASQCELAIPLQFGGRVIGVLNLESEHRDAFARDDIAVLESLANEIAVSLHNAHTFEALEDANRELAQATLHAKQANVLKSRFLLNASHKLRTPLNAVIGYSETIVSGVYGDLPETVLDRQRRILENGRQLQALIEDMLDLSAIESGHMELDLTAVELPPLMREVMNAAQALHQTGYPAHDITLHLELPDTLPPVRADVNRLRYMLINLMSNAVKFTESGSVTMHAEATAEAVLVHVADTGPGIREAELAHLFEPFQHQRGSTASSGKGTGLGLPVSKLLAEMHGGDLTVETQLHAGSTFTLRLQRDDV